MIKNKLFQMLETLKNEDEWDDFEQFVMSPYFNKSEKCKQLLIYLKKKRFQRYAWKRLTKYKIIDHLIIEPLLEKRIQTKADDKYLGVIMSQLKKLLEQYFIQKQLESQLFYREHFLKNGFIERDLLTHYEVEKKQEVRTLKHLENNRLLKKGLDFYLSEYLSGMDEFKFSQKQKGRKLTNKDVADTTQKLDNFYLVNRLYLMNCMLSVQDNLSIEEKLPFYETIAEIAKAKIHNNSLLNSYFTSLQLFLNPKQEHLLENIQAQIEQQSKSIPKQELNDFYTILSNHYIREGNQTDKKYFRKALDLYKLMAKYKFLCPSDYITEGKVKNIVAISCFFKEFNWVEQFIKDYESKFPSPNQKDIYYYNLATLYFYQKKFDMALENLKHVTKVDKFYDADGRSLNLRIFYEKKEFDYILSVIPAFKAYIESSIKGTKRFTSKYKLPYVKFINILRQLANIQISPSSSDREASKVKLLNKIKQSPNPYHKQWLLEKINEL